MRRRSAIEPVIGHAKNEHRMDRNYLAGRNGDANNAILAAVGYNLEYPEPADQAPAFNPLAQDTLATLPDHALRSAKPAAKLPT